MQSFKSSSEVEQARLPPRIKLAVQRCMNALLEAYGSDYDPEDDGWVVLVDRNTTDLHALELFGVPWRELRLEGVCYDQDSGCFLTCWLASNQFGHSIIVPDLPWLDPALRTHLMNEMT